MIRTMTSTTLTHVVARTLLSQVKNRRDGAANAMQTDTILLRQGGIQQQQENDPEVSIRNHQGPNDSDRGALPPEDEPEYGGDPPRQTTSLVWVGYRPGAIRGRDIEDAQRHQQHSNVLKPEQGTGRGLVEAGKKHVGRKNRGNRKTEIEEDSEPYDSPKPLCAGAHELTSIIVVVTQATLAGVLFVS